MNSIKFFTCRIMHKWCNLCVHRYGSKGINWNFWSFLMNLTQVNKSRSCEPLGDFLHLSYNYKCMCFKWHSQGKKWMLSIAKTVYFLFRKQRTTAYLSVCMHVVATLLDIKWIRIWITLKINKRINKINGRNICICLFN